MSIKTPSTQKVHERELDENNKKEAAIKAELIKSRLLWQYGFAQKLRFGAGSLSPLILLGSFGLIAWLAQQAAVHSVSIEGMAGWAVIITIMWFGAFFLAKRFKDVHRFAALVLMLVEDILGGFFFPSVIMILWLLWFFGISF